MIRTPLRPLARVLDAREKGENPDVIEAQERAKRNQVIQSKIRHRAEFRLVVLGVAFFLAFGTIGARMAILASSEAQEPRSTASSSRILNQRADIVDRNGAVLATNLATTALYGQPPLMVDPEKAANGLADIFPDLDRKRLVADFTGGKRKFLWVKKKLSPEQRQQVYDLGEPGLLFGPREMRLYPNGRLAAHILGGASFGKEGVSSAEVIGIAGVEKQFDELLRSPELDGRALELSIDLTAQSTLRHVLSGGMKLMRAKGAAAVLMDVQTGEILSMVSLPDFDPNNRPLPPVKGDPSQSPLFNRAAQGVYELGSTFKLFTAAASLERGLVTLDTMIDTKGPIRAGGFKISDFHPMGPELPVREVIVQSSNIGTARIALAAGTDVQKAILSDMGFFEPVNVELGEASHAWPLYPKKWTDLSTMTISYGHGFAATPLHLASAYATLVNGGYRVEPTLLRQTKPRPTGKQVLSAKTSAQIRGLMRQVVVRGTASLGEAEGYEVGGKTGTADKPNPSGGYYENKVISTFASAFPMSDPKYVLVVTLDEPSIDAYGEERRTAGWTAVPVAAEIITRLAPILGLRPTVDEAGAMDYTQAKN